MSAPNRASAVVSGFLTAAMISPAISAPPEDLVDVDTGGISYTGTPVGMFEHDAKTFYVDTELPGGKQQRFMVDTGSGYPTINERILAELQSIGAARYVKQLKGILANGSEMEIPVYAIDQVKTGNCTLSDVEAAVFPGNSRAILGLEFLRGQGRYVTFDFGNAATGEPPRLIMSCENTPTTRLATTDGPIPRAP